MSKSLDLDRRELKKVFAAPWHAEIFALTVHLNEEGHFCWTEWASCLGKNLEIAGRDKAGSAVVQERDSSDCYYQIWLNTLIEMMVEKGVVDLKTLDDMKAQWAKAYSQTPHGQPVTI